MMLTVSDYLSNIKQVPVPSYYRLCKNRYSQRAGLTIVTDFERRFLGNLFWLMFPLVCYLVLQPVLKKARTPRDTRS